MRCLDESVTGIEPNAGDAADRREALDLGEPTTRLAPGPFATARFDLIRADHALEHLNDPMKYSAMVAK